MIYDPDENDDETSSDDTETGQSEYADDVLGYGEIKEEAEATTPNQYKVTVDSDND